MLENTEIRGWAAGSYNYNFEAQHNAATATANRTSSHPATNSFAVDQVWISIDNAATEDSRGGAHVDYEWGSVNGAGTGGALYTAFASYLAPIHNDVQIDTGLLPTLMGAEVNQTNANYNITRGLVWDWQLTPHVGAIVHGNLTDNWTAAIGVINHIGFLEQRPGDQPALLDTNNQKAVTGQIGYSEENWRATGSFAWGEQPGGIDVGIYDLVIHCLGEDGMTSWLNYTLRTTSDGTDEGEIHGIAVAGRLVLSEKMGASLRGEVLILDWDRGASEQYSITATTDHVLTSQLTAKLEVRIDIDSDDRLIDSDGSRNEDIAAMAIAQLIYSF